MCTFIPRTLFPFLFFIEAAMSIIPAMRTRTAPARFPWSPVFGEPFVCTNQPPLPFFPLIEALIFPYNRRVSVSSSDVRYFPNLFPVSLI